MAGEIKNNNKSGLITLLFLLSIAGAGYLLIKHMNTITDPIDSEGIFVAPTLAGSKGILRGLYKYYVDGKEYRIEGFYDNNLVLGDKFRLEYSKGNPRNAKLIAYEPILDTKASKVVTYAYITEVRSFFGLGHWVNFKYTVEGTVYFKSQHARPEFSLRDIKVGDRKSVVYQTENPRRCILNLENKID